MKPQRCIATSGEPGDCYRACLATITGLDIRDLPNFGKGHRNDPENMEQMWNEVREFLAPHGLSIFNNYCNGEWSLERMLDYFSRYNSGVPIILTGKPKYHSDPAHSVVALDGKIVHDPSGAGIAGACGEWWFFDAVCVTDKWEMPSCASLAA